MLDQLHFPLNLHLGSVPVPGEENILELKKNVKAFPNYDLDSYDRKGTSGERTKARFQGAIVGTSCRSSFWHARFV